MPRGLLYYEVLGLINPKRRRTSRSNHGFLKVIVEHELGDVLESLERGVCPFCGRVFSSYRIARAHIAKSDCAFALKASVERVILLCRRINSYVRYSGKRYYLRIGDYCTPVFNTKRDLALYVVRSGLLDKLKSTF
jgi:hypothetical protein